MKVSLKNKKIGSLFLLLLVIFVILAMLFIVYVSIDRGKRLQAYQTSDLLIDQVKNILKGNSRKEQSLSESLKESYISKAKSVAYIIDNVPETEYDIEELTRIAKLMSIDEIHLFTPDGTIYFGTVPKYYNYSFDSGEQMAYFKPMLTNKKLSMCQDITPNTAEAKPMMYAICWNDPGTRMIQVGIEPRRLIREMQSNEMSEVISNIPAYDGVSIFVSDKETGKILGATARKHIGRTMSDIGLGKVSPETEAYTHFRAHVDKIDSYCTACKKDGYIITVIQDRTQVNKELPYTLLLIAVYLIIAVVVLAVVIKKMADRRERLMDISQRAVAASEAKTSFLSNMSHEIRTPINAILGMNEMIARESNSKEVLTYSQNIKNAGNTLLGLVNDILDFSKIEEGKLELIETDYDLSSVINDLVNMIKKRLDDKGLIFDLDIDKDTPKFLHGDEIRLKQIIMNILTNAAKYTEKGGVTFRVTYETIEEDPDRIFLKVSVKDTGIGIKRDDLEKLFTRFERIEEKRNRNIEGTGLGMNIIKELLGLMGSALEVKSVYGVGSEFGFSLKQKVVKWAPVGRYEEIWKPANIKAEKYKHKFEAPAACVLVVDDNELNLTVFSGLLKQTRIKIDTATNGDDGIRMARSVKYDIIFLDHMMPHKDGIEVLHELKADRNNPNLNTPYVCLTANALSSAREEYLKEGFEDYLSKPINTDELEDLLIKYLPENKVTVSSHAPRQEEKADERDPNKRLRVLEDYGVNLEAGFRNTGSSDDYMPVLTVFYEDLEGNLNEIEEFFNSGNYEDYTTKVHALKSSARIIGASALGEMAQALENAGKAGDLDYLKANHSSFIEKCRKLKEPLDKIFEPKNDRTDMPEADSFTMEEAYKEIKDAAEDLDYDRIEAVFEELKGYTIPANEQELYKCLNNAARNFDYNKIIELLSHIPE